MASLEFFKYDRVKTFIHVRDSDSYHVHSRWSGVVALSIRKTWNFPTAPTHYCGNVDKH